MKPKSKRGRRIVEEDGNGEDKISTLPDDVINHIYSFIDSKYAVQSSVLSSRWRHVWKTLHHLNLNSSEFAGIWEFLKFAQELLSHRNHKTDVKTLNYFQSGVLSPGVVKKIVNYAIAHNVKNMFIKSDSACSYESEFTISLFDSRCLEKLTVAMGLTLINPFGDAPWALPNFMEFTLSFLEIPGCAWSLKALTSLQLTDIKFSEDNVICFSDFVNLTRLSLCNCTISFDMGTFEIFSDRIEHLTISNTNWCKSDRYEIELYRSCKFVVSAPRLCCFVFEGLYPLYLSTSHMYCLDKVFINCMERAYGNSDSAYRVNKRNLNVIGQQLLDMFKELSHANCLMLTSHTIKVLSKIPDILERSVSPFNLESLKLQKKSITSTIPSHVESYLLSSFQVVPRYDSVSSNIRSLDTRTVAINAGKDAPPSVIIDHLDREGIANLNAMGVTKARKVSRGCDLWSIATK